MFILFRLTVAISDRVISYKNLLIPQLIVYRTLVRQKLKMLERALHFSPF